ncbi:MAG: hypothetical protein AABN34_29440, partial [Acidobacteriota bacterium]
IAQKKRTGKFDTDLTHTPEPRGDPLNRIVIWDFEIWDFEEISPISDRAFFLNQALQALCEAQATVGDTQAAKRSARGLTQWHEQLHAIVGIAVVRAKAGDT